MPHPLLIISQSNALIEMVDINRTANSEDQPTDLDPYCLERQSISRSSKTRVKKSLILSTEHPVKTDDAHGDLLI